MQNIVNKKVNELNSNMIDKLKTITDEDTISYLFCYLIPFESDVRYINFDNIYNFSDKINDQV